MFLLLPLVLFACLAACQGAGRYLVDDVTATASGVELSLSLDPQAQQKFDTPACRLLVSATAHTDHILHIKITDPDKKRWEVPCSITPCPQTDTQSMSNPVYSFRHADKGQSFWFEVTRLRDGEKIISTVGDFVFEDRYLEISTSLCERTHIYGLGERKDPFELYSANYTLWAYDLATPRHLNNYGSHPMYLGMNEHNSAAHVVFLRNSNGMDVQLSARTLTYKVIGGVLDFYIAMGPTPEAAIQQYASLIGRPHMPPAWALGMHQCKWGYRNISEVSTVVENYKKAHIPLEVMWTDIDYMDGYRDFTYDPDRFPVDKMKEFAEQLHKNGQRYVHIIDPGIKVDPGYFAYEEGVKRDVFIRYNHTEGYLVGKVWPDLVHYPDFLNPATHSYWQDMVMRSRDLVPVDGLWIDMNEASNFCDGFCSDTDKPTGPLNDPPYKIDNMGDHFALYNKTISMDGMHIDNITEYDAHNLYGISESIATHKALENLTQTRSFVISRSTFPGSGRVAGHWTGDNFASWKDLYYSVPAQLNNHMFQIPLVGADTCGFGGNTTEELCARWSALASFSTFTRNHNTIGAMSQEPYLWKSVTATMRKYLSMKYTLLPYYYAHFKRINDFGGTIIRPLFFEFWNDVKTYSIDRQFLVGEWLLVSPVLKKKTRKLKAYLPQGTWYDVSNGIDKAQGVVQSSGETVTLDTPMDTIGVHVRGGGVIPINEPGMTIGATLGGQLGLLVALDSRGGANGHAYLDDGLTISPQDYARAQFTVRNGVLSSKGMLQGQLPNHIQANITHVTVLGVSCEPKNVIVNANENRRRHVKVRYLRRGKLGILTVERFSVPIYTDFTMDWSKHDCKHEHDAVANEAVPEQYNTSLVTVLTTLMSFFILVGGFLYLRRHPKFTGYVPIQTDDV